MKVLIIFACLLAVTFAQYAPQHWQHYGGYGRRAPLDHIGRAIDTPAIAARKAGHFEALAEARARNAAGWYGYGNDGAWRGDGGYERSANYAGWRQGWSGYGGYGAGAYGAGWAGHNRYNGPIHLPLIKKDGNLVNTPDVAESRRRHQERLAINAARSSGHGYGWGLDGYGQEHGAYIPVGYGSYGRQY